MGVLWRQLALVTAVFVASSTGTALPRADASEPHDHFGLGLSLARICDLTPGAPITDECRAFVGAVVEMTLTSQLLRAEIEMALSNNLLHRHAVDEGIWLFVRSCVPLYLTLDQIIEAVRSHVDTLCGGRCTETGYVLFALRSAYPCPEE